MDFEWSDAVLWHAVDVIITSAGRLMMRYTLALAATAAAGLVNAGLWAEVGTRFPLIAFFPAIAVSAWLGGFWPGALSTAVSAFAASYLWLAPQFFTRPSHQGDALILTLFVGTCLSGAWFFETLRRRTEAEQRPVVDNARVLTASAHKGP